MKVTLRSEKVVCDEGVMRGTGKSFAEWWKALDAFGGPAKGRREIGKHLFGELKVDPWWSATLQVEYERHEGVVEKDGRAGATRSARRSRSRRLRRGAGRCSRPARRSTGGSARRTSST